MIHYVLEAHQQVGILLQNTAVPKSIVSSELATAIAEKYNTKMSNILTSFRFITEKVQQYEEDHGQTFMFGSEESRGYLTKPFICDKDAIQVLVLLAEVVAFYRRQGRTLYDGLQDIFEEFGRFEEKTTSVTIGGIEGSGKAKALMVKCHEQTPVEFVGIQAAQMGDFKELTCISAGGRTEQLQTPPSDVLEYHLEDGGWVAIRPPGTKPKIRFCLATKVASNSEASEKIAMFKTVVNELTK